MLKEQTAKLKRELWKYRCDDGVIGVSCTPNLSSIVAASVDKHVYLLSRDGRLRWKKKVDYPAWNVSISPDGKLIAVATASKTPYNGSVYAFDSTGRLLWRHKIGAPVWSVSVSNDRKLIVAGSWDNNVYLLDARAGSERVLLKYSAGTKGVYGTSISGDGKIITAGSFDGSIVILDKKGQTLRKYSTEGGIYGVSMSADSTNIAAGCQDGALYLISYNKDELLREEIALEELCGVSLSQGGNLVVAGSFDSHIYLVHDGDLIWKHRTGDKVWGVAMTPDGKFVCAGSSDSNVYLLENGYTETYANHLDRKAQAILRRHTREHDFNAKACCSELAQLYLGHNLPSKAISNVETIWSKNKDNPDVRNILRSLLQTKILSEPHDHLTHFKLGALHRSEGNVEDAIRELQISAKFPPLRARAQELLAECFSQMGKLEETHPFFGLEYDEIKYLKYDYAAVEDEVKKILEISNALKRIKKIPNLRRSLDIGCATGRYPLLLGKLGIEAHGIDNEEESIRICRDKKNSEGIDHVHFHQMDALNLSFPDNYFELVTCMMGTFTHFGPEQKIKVLSEAYRILNPGGKIIISTWNPECEHGRFLTIYQKADRDIIRSNMIKKDDMTRLLISMGFEVNEVFQFCIMPDNFYSELDLGNITKEIFSGLMIMDWVASSNFPQLAGQMYMIIGNKRSVG